MTTMWSYFPCSVCWVDREFRRGTSINIVHCGLVEEGEREGGRERGHKLDSD